MDSQPNMPPIPPPQQLNMDKLIEQLFERMVRLETDVKECHNNHRQTLEIQNGAMVRVLEQNTRILESINNHLSSWERKRAPRAAKRMI